MKLALILFSTAAYAAITNVTVVGTTATQAKIQYTAPNGSPCTLEVSESNTYSPLVYDVDVSLFTGANADNRTSAISNGTSREFPVGTRRAEKALDGHWYSRALQAYTAHYFRITCGSDTATGRSGTRA